MAYWIADEFDKCRCQRNINANLAKNGTSLNTLGAPNGSLFDSSGALTTAGQSQLTAFEKTYGTTFTDPLTGQVTDLYPVGQPPADTLSDYQQDFPSGTGILKPGTGTAADLPDQ